MEASTLIKKLGFFIIGIFFLGLYASISVQVFSGKDIGVQYIQSEFMFGSVTLLGLFVTMTIILLIVCNYLVDKFIKNSKK